MIGEESPARRSNLLRLLLFVVLAGLAARVVAYALDPPIYRDEAYLLNNVLLRTYGGLLKPLENQQVAPPAFLWVEKWSSGLARSDQVMRLLPFAAGLAGVGLFAIVCRLALRGPAAWFALAVFSISHVAVVAANRAKPYSTDLVVSVVFLLLALSWFRRPRRGWAIAVAVVLAPLCVWMSYTSIFVIGGVGLMMAIYALAPASQLCSGRPPCRPFGEQNGRHRGRPLPDGEDCGPKEAFAHHNGVPMRAWAAIITLGVLSLASFAMLYAVHLKAARGSGSSAGLEEFWAEAFPPIGGFAKTLWWLVTTHTGRLYSYPVGEKNFGSTLSFVLWILGIRALWKRPGGKWLLGVLLLPQALLLAAACLHLYPYGGHPRINLFLAPSMCLLIGAGLAHVSGFLKPAARRQWRTVAAALLLLLPIGEIGQGVYAAWSSSREPSIRDSLAQAAGELHPGNEVICLMDPASLNKGGPARQVFEYYARRTFGARARWVSELPPHVTTAGQSSGAKTLVIEYVSAERLGSSPDQNAATCNNRAPIVAQRPEAPCCTIVHGLKDQIRIWHYEGRADAGRSHDARTTSDDPAGRP